MTISEPLPTGKRVQLDLFLVSILILFLELACIRWFPAHTLFLTFFTNTVLLACFLGMSIGCLCASSRWNMLNYTPSLLGLGLLVGFSVERLMGAGVQNFVDVGNQASPQLVFFGAEYHTGDLAKFRIPVEVINGFFFLMIALTFVGPGQLLGRSLGQIPDRVGLHHQHPGQPARHRTVRRILRFTFRRSGGSCPRFWASVIFSCLGSSRVSRSWRGRRGRSCSPAFRSSRDGIPAR